MPTLEATGRVLARAQRSTMDVPPMDNSAMDGYAVRASDLKRPERACGSRRRSWPAPSASRCEPGTAARIFTGAPIPPGADAIVMQEHTAAEGEYVVIEEDSRSRASGFATSAAT